jgi:antitoxin YobK
MGMTELEDALQAVRDSDMAWFAGPRAPELVSSAEQVLGVLLPPTYRRFLLALGAGHIVGFEFYGVLHENFEDSAVPDGVWLTMTEREQIGLPEALVIVAETGYGEYYALDTDQRDADDECPVVIWVPHLAEGSQLEVIAPDFGSFFWRVIEEAWGPPD